MKPPTAEKNRVRARTVISGALRALVVVAAAVLAAGLLVGCGTDGAPITRPDSTTGPAAPPTVSEDAAPDFSGVTLEGVDVSLSEYRGRPLVLAFMASW